MFKCVNARTLPLTLDRGNDKAIKIPLNCSHRSPPKSYFLNIYYTTTHVRINHNLNFGRG